jgi:DNA repair protein RecO (recombination protein O)
MAIKNDQGIVLRTYSFGEADKVVVLISATSGKLRCVAKGIRKTKSRFGGRLEQFVHVDLVLYEGRNLGTITQAEVVEAYPKLRTDLEAVSVAATMAEITDLVVQEDEPSIGMFLLLQRGLGALEQGGHRTDLLTHFMLRTAGIIGFTPALDACASCGSDAIERFSFSAGGAVCRNCSPTDSVLLRVGVADHLLQVANREVITEPQLAQDAQGVARKFLEFHLERPMKSMSVLSV